MQFFRICNSYFFQNLQFLHFSKFVILISLMAFIFYFVEAYAEEALIARLSYSASLRAEESRLRAMSKLTVKQVAKLALLFCLLVRFSALCTFGVCHCLWYHGEILNKIEIIFHELQLKNLYQLPYCNSYIFVWD